MKRIICALLVVLLVTFSACASEKSFKENTSCEDIMNAAIEATVHPDSDKIYTKSQDNLDAYALSLWADGLYAESSDLSIISDYAIFVSAGTTTYEVAVLKTSDMSLTDKLEDLLERRKETLSLGDKGMYDPDFKKRMSSSKIIKTDNFVFMIITDDNNAALDAIEKLK